MLLEDRLEDTERGVSEPSCHVRLWVVSGWVSLLSSSVMGWKVPKTINISKWKLVVKNIIFRSSSALNDVRGGTGGAGTEVNNVLWKVFSVQKCNPFFVNSNLEQV